MDKKIRVVMYLDIEELDEYADPTHEMGITNEAYETKHVDISFYSKECDKRTHMSADDVTFTLVDADEDPASLEA